MRKRSKAPRISLEPLIVRSTRERVPKSFLARWTEAVTEEFTRQPLPKKARLLLEDAGEVTYVFVSKKEIQRLNREFRGKDRPTDVLSFAPTNEGSLGELVFSLEVIRAQAVEHRLSFQDELGYMVLHGLLHLLGYDHEVSESKARAMFKLQDHIFDLLRAS